MAKRFVPISANLKDFVIVAGVAKFYGLKLSRFVYFYKGVYYAKYTGSIGLIHYCDRFDCVLTQLPNGYVKVRPKQVPDKRCKECGKLFREHNRTGYCPACDEYIANKLLGGIKHGYREVC